MRGGRAVRPHPIKAALLGGEGRHHSAYGGGGAADGPQHGHHAQVGIDDDSPHRGGGEKGGAGAVRLESAWKGTDIGCLVGGWVARVTEWKGDTCQLWMRVLGAGT